MSMTDAEIREALARAERATGGECIVRNRYSHGGGRMYREDGPARDLILDVYDEANREFYFAARTDVPRLAADLLAARAERDEARAAHESERRVYGEDVRINAARAETAEARCRELEAERAIVADYLRDTDADFRARRPSERAVLDALLSPPPPHTCQIHRATSGASDCGLSPCEEAKVHTDRGASRPATVRRVRPAPSQEARCGSRTKLRGSDGRPLCERHGGVRVNFQQNDEPCIRVQPTPSPEATETWRDPIGCAPSPPGSISSEEAVRRVRDGETTPFEADTMTHEDGGVA